MYLETGRTPELPLDVFSRMLDVRQDIELKILSRDGSTWWKQTCWLKELFKNPL